MRQAIASHSLTIRIFVVALIVVFSMPLTGTAGAQSSSGGGGSLTGWRVGAGVGRLFSNSKITDITAYGATPLGPFYGQDFVSDSQPFGEIHVGYDFLAGSNFLIGIQGGIEIGGRTTTQTLLSLTGADSFVPTLCCNDTAKYSVSVNASHRLTPIGSLRGRAGLLISERMLVFVTFGGAIVQSRWQLQQSGVYPVTTTFVSAFMPPLTSIGVFPAQNISAASYKIAPTLGGGIEYGLNSNWSIRTEYTAAFFDGANASASVIGSVNVGRMTPILNSVASANSVMHRLSVGLDYHF